MNATASSLPRPAARLGFTAVCLSLLLVLASLPGRAQQDKPAEPAPPSPDRAALEKKFQDTLTQSVFVGRWSVIRDGTLGPEREEKYSIQGVSKVGGDVWLIHARIQYGKTDVNVPIPVQVKWAGDTPVISLTDMAIPGVGTYTARVVVHGQLYAGTWSGGDHGGVLSGVIQKSAPATPGQADGKNETNPKSR